MDFEEMVLIIVGMAMMLIGIYAINVNYLFSGLFLYVAAFIGVVILLYTYYDEIQDENNSLERFTKDD